MFIGHFGIGFGAKAAAPKVSLGSLFLAAQFLDLLWPALLLLDIEHVRVSPGATAVTPLLFEHYPYSHSLLAAAGWAVAVGCIYLLLRRNSPGAIVLGMLVISHWGLDAIVHRPDLPLFPGSTTMIGLNAWASLPLTVLIEISLFTAGVWLYSRATTPKDAFGHWGFASLLLVLLAIYAGNLLGPPPPDPKAIAWAGQLQWLLVLWGYWIDNHRQCSSHARAVYPGSTARDSRGT
jgi:membrane-bound metal-dependent hydrolase YbcI (DUF457 family)